MNLPTRKYNADPALFRRVAIRARVLDTTGMRDTNREGAIVLITRDARHLDGTVATDDPATWGEPGVNYELMEN